MTAAVEALAGNAWAAIAVALGGFVALFAVLQVVVRAADVEPETSRKMFHAGSGTLTLAFPFVFEDTWPVLLLTGAAGLVVAGVKFLPALRDRWGAVITRVERPTLGELYFPFSVALLFWLTREDDPLLFVVPVLLLTFADATCALVGARYGMTRYVGASKSLEGSVAFAVVAFLCVHVPLLLWSEVGRAESLLIAATLALLVMLLEGSAWRGLDNLFVPVGGYFLLHAFMPLDAGALLPRFLVTVAMVSGAVLIRERTTLEDDSIVAGAFLCYVAWALMGWRWLIGPAAILSGYRWLSPATPANSRRMHGVPAVLSVWAPAVAWIALARRSGDAAMLLPYTMAFGAHLAMFGVSRLAFQFPERPPGALFWRAVVTSWAIVAVPYVLAAGVGWRIPIAAGAGFVAIAIGTTAFRAAEPDLRNVSQEGRRWATQAAAAGLASIAAWAIAASLSRLAA